MFEKTARANKPMRVISSARLIYSFHYNIVYGWWPFSIVLVSKGPSIYFTIKFAVWYFKTKLKNIMNNIQRNTIANNNLIKKKKNIYNKKKTKETLISDLL